MIKKYLDSFDDWIELMVYVRFGPCLLQDASKLLKTEIRLENINTTTSIFPNERLNDDITPQDVLVRFLCDIVLVGFQILLIRT